MSTDTRWHLRRFPWGDSTYVRPLDRDGWEVFQEVRSSLQVPSIPQRTSILRSEGTTLTRWGTDKMSGKGVLGESRSLLGPRVVGRRLKSQRRGKSSPWGRRWTGKSYGEKFIDRSHTVRISTKQTTTLFEKDRYRSDSKTLDIKI